MMMTDIIEAKKHGSELSREQLEFAVNGFVDGSVPDYQMSALLMAVCFNGMTSEETATLTDIMSHSGDTVDLACLGSMTVDKHSTGGVGDKTTLIVAPLAASLGCVVAKMSGRGLGHTGGTIDKLESVKGFDTALSTDEFFRLAKENGVVVAGQTGNLVPADKKMYALRDVTATVESIPLIASSIMSKKLASGAQAIVLDVKAGAGAFMKDADAARKLAREMTAIGNSCGRKTSALITDMEIPLGRAVGNSLEVAEAVEVLRGGGDNRLRELCIALAAAMLSLASGEDINICTKKAKQSLSEGKAYNVFRRWIAAQGGDVRLIDDTSLLQAADYIHEVKSPRSGYVTAVNALGIGKTSMLLGAGREKKEDCIEPSAGVYLNKTYAEHVKSGEVIATLHTSKAGVIPQAEALLLESFTIGDSSPSQRPVIIDTVL